MQLSAVNLSLCTLKGENKMTKRPRMAKQDDVPVRNLSITAAPLNPSQREYAALIRTQELVLGLGPAGTGKTYIAAVEAAKAYARGQVKKIVLTRPVREAGEQLGYLPGSFEEKIAPYLLPLYDALVELMGKGRVDCDMRNGNIEVAPIAYLRGRTLKDAFVIIDEAQNTTVEQMKLIVTRFGEGTRAVITGDLGQSDLKGVGENGLAYAARVFQDMPEVGIHLFDKSCIVRSSLVAALVERMETAEATSQQTALKVWTERTGRRDFESAVSNAVRITGQVDTRWSAV